MDASLFFVNMFGQGCLGFVIGVIAYYSNLLPASNTNWLVFGLFGVFGAFIGTKFLKNTKYYANNNANWIAALIGSFVIFVFYFVVNYFDL